MIDLKIFSLVNTWGCNIFSVIIEDCQAKTTVGHWFCMPFTARWSKHTRLSSYDLCSATVMLLQRNATRYFEKATTA